MVKQGKLPAILAGSAIFLIFLFLYNFSFRNNTIQNIGLGEWSPPKETSEPNIHLKPTFTSGTTVAGVSYNKTLVVSTTSEEDTSWMEDEIPDIYKVFYVADDRHAAHHPPRNKGHEVMNYLSFIIDEYDDLPDVMIFMHSHRHAWHNSETLGGDAAEMIRRLSPHRVIRDGYTNMRCQWHPGCPEWLYPSRTENNRGKIEEVEIARAWAQLFPLDPVPDVLAQPCCSQFAVSRDRVRAIPKARYVYWRNWLLRTKMRDSLSGRVWEYIWQYVFTGNSYFCPAAHVCYCDGYGICYGGPEQYREWLDLRTQRDNYAYELDEWEAKEKEVQAAMDEGRVEDVANMDIPVKGRDVVLRDNIASINSDLAQRTQQAIERGNDPRTRALEAGRPWQEGDGF